MFISEAQLMCLRLLLGAAFSTWMLCPENNFCLCDPESGDKKCFDSESAQLICSWAPEPTQDLVLPKQEPSEYFEYENYEEPEEEEEKLPLEEYNFNVKEEQEKEEEEEKISVNVATKDQVSFNQ